MLPGTAQEWMRGVEPWVSLPAPSSSDLILKLGESWCESGCTEQHPPAAIRPLTSHFLAAKFQFGKATHFPKVRPSRIPFPVNLEKAVSFQLCRPATLRETPPPMLSER